MDEKADDMNEPMNRRIFMKITGQSICTAGLGGLWFHANSYAKGSVRFPSFKDIGDTFRFAIFADPQVGPTEGGAEIYLNARRTQIEAINEINAMDPKPAFALYLGDLVNFPNKTSFDNFENCIKHAKMQQILVHGNHDTSPPYTLFKEVAQRVSGIDEVFFSFDLGPWHFIGLPCNLPGKKPVQQRIEKQMLSWLAADLRINKDRPTIVFEHLHTMPQGLTQTEFYTFRLELRRRLMDLYTRYGNVKWYFNGHVHNGIQASLKTAWTYQGINFITAPTIIQPRPFGEELPEYAQGSSTGGYYLIVDINGDDVTVKGRLVGVDKPYIYPKQFREYTDDIEPRWFKTLAEARPEKELENGNFENDLAGWQVCYRYIADEDPAYVFKTQSEIKHSGTRALYIMTQAKPPKWWANDEITEIYQNVINPRGGDPVLKACYYLRQRYSNGGGYIRIHAMRNSGLKCLMMFKLGENEYDSIYYPNFVGCGLLGEPGGWRFLQDCAKEKRAMFWDIPDATEKWHELTVNIASLYDSVCGRSGAFNTLGVNKIFVGLGTWANCEPGSRCGMYFDDIELTAAQYTVDSMVDDQPLKTDASVFETQFGQCIIDNHEQRKKERETGYR